MISNSKADLFALETAIVEELVRFQGVSTAVASTALARGAVIDNYLTRAITKNYHPKRSGNIYVVFNPGWFINDLDGISVAVVHGSPWPYDTFVPIIFAGHNVKPQTVSRRVHTVDVAMTLSNIVGAKPPSGANGKVLFEVIEP